MSSKITISRPVVKMRPVQRQRVFLKARDERCSTEMSDRLYGYEKRIRAVLPSSRDTDSKVPDSHWNLLPLVLLPISCSAKVCEVTSPVYKRLRYPFISTAIAQLLYLTTLVIFPQFTIILSTAVIVVILSLRPLALVYKLLLSSTHSFLCRLESRLAGRFTLLQTSLDNHLDKLVKDFEEKARNRNLKPSENTTQILPISHSSPKIPPLQHPALTPKEASNILSRQALQQDLPRNPPAAVAEFDNEGWLLVCDPELGHRRNHPLFWTNDKNAVKPMANAL